MATYRTLLQQDRGWGLLCQMSVAPLVAGTLEWLIAVGACWFIGAPYAAPWTWLAHLAAAYLRTGCGAAPLGRVGRPRRRARALADHISGLIGLVGLLRTALAGLGGLGIRAHRLKV